MMNQKDQISISTKVHTYITQIYILPEVCCVYLHDNYNYHADTEEYFVQFVKETRSKVEEKVRQSSQDDKTQKLSIKVLCKYCDIHEWTIGPVHTI